MTKSGAAWPAEATRFLALRLGPGDDLRAALEDAFTDMPEEAGFVAAAIGSLSSAHLRHAGEDAGTEIEGPLEIVSLSGTFSVDGPHLHAALSDRHGQMTGGHVLHGCMVRTTAEIVLGLTAALRFSRSHDAKTGYAELAITPRGD